ncbi:hypothetical protein [Pseudomonas asplenii]|uniref:hypothetical protein n=1 Tax=Pseudomonas asplenii TaxID=53407 RepID=UPI0003A9167D|nr:hypothetical protein [Pseudomonas fuscovaginae]
MNALLVELPPFARHHRVCLGEEAFRCFQLALLHDPEAGEVIQGTGGPRKVRCVDLRTNPCPWKTGNRVLEKYPETIEHLASLGRGSWERLAAPRISGVLEILARC